MDDQTKDGDQGKSVSEQSPKEKNSAMTHESGQHPGGGPGQKSKESAEEGKVTHQDEDDIHPVELAEAYGRSYLDLSDVDKFTRFSLELSRNEAASDPASRVDHMLSVAAEVRPGIVRKRNKMVQEMDAAEVLLILAQLGERNLNLPDDEYDERFNDPEKGPLLRRLHEIGIPTFLDPSHNKRQAMAVLAEADDRTSIKRPELPCSLEDALRYSENNSTIAYKVLLEAYSEMLPGLVPISFTSDEILLINSLPIAERLNKIHELKRSSNPQFDPESDPEDLDEEERFHFFYSPEDQAEAVVGTDLKPIASLEVLERIVTEFYRFWECNGKKFKDQHEKGKLAKQQRNSALNENRAVAMENRERPKWIKRVTDFVRFISEFDKPMENDQVLHQISIFVDQCDGANHPKTKRKVGNFLAAIAISVNNKKNEVFPREIKKLLSGKDVRMSSGKFGKGEFASLSDAVICECCEILKVSLTCRNSTARTFTEKGETGGRQQSKKTNQIGELSEKRKRSTDRNLPGEP